MTSRLFFIAVLLVAVVPLVALQQPAPPPMPDAQTIQKMAARFAPTEIGADLSKLSDDRSPRAREAGRGVQDRRRAVPAPGVGRQRGDAARSGARSVADRARAAALLPDQQGPVVAARSQPGLRAGRAAQAGGGQLLSGGRVEGRDRALDSVAARGGARARHRLLHRDPPRRQQLHAGALQRRIPGRAGARRGAAARGGAARDRADAARRS